MVAYTEVSNENLSGLYNVILDKVSQAQYIAIDCEFTGHLRGLITNLEQRYDGMAQIVRSHSILSVGLTTITADRAFDNFEFLLNNQNPYQANASNLKFLAENGFDFNRHYSIGIPFRPGPYSFAPDKKKGGSTKQKQRQQQQQQEQEKQERRLRELWFDIFCILRTKGIPLIVHNGLLDLMYIYQSFITSIPAKLSGFVADMVEAFPAGIYDTKYIANHVLYEQTSFLSYLYHKYERSGYEVHVQDALLPEKTDQVADSRPKKRQRKDNGSSNKENDGICDQYAARGWCPAGQACERSHDLNRILDRDQKVNAADTKGQQPQPELAPAESVPAAVEEKSQEQAPLPQPSSLPKKEHSSHFDAFMTGYIFCHMVNKLLENEDVGDIMNKLNVMKLDVPLRITKSTYAKPTLQWKVVSQNLQNKPVPR